MKLIEFEVKGQLHFPIDMLRYDGCFPARGEDASRIEGTFEHGRSREPVRVRLFKWSDAKSWKPEFGRWASFMWSVDRESIRVVR